MNMIRHVFIIISLTAAVLPAAKLQFVGLQSYRSDALIEAIAGRLDYIQDRPATTFRADDAAFLVEGYLQNHGLPDAEVTWSLPGNDTIRLIVDEGSAKYLGQITVSGADDPEEIIDQFKAPFPETGERRAFQADEVSTGVSRVTDLMHARGYWDAVVTANRGVRNSNGEIPYNLNIVAGKLFTLAKPVLESPVSPDLKLQEKLLEVVDQTATAEKIVAIRKTIQESFRKRGYSEISLMMSKETQGSRLKLRFTLTPGERYSVRSLEIEGLEKTRKNRISKRFSGVVGETYDENEINESIKKLLSTGAFDRIQMRNKEAGSSLLDLTLELSEAKARGYSFSAGFGSIEGFILGAKYYDRNLQGRLWNFTAGTEITSLGVLGEISLTDPFFLDRDLVLSNRLYLITRNYESYEKFQGGFNSELSWKYGDHYSASVAAETSYTKITSSLPDELIGPTDYTLQRIRFRQQYDRRDDPALPGSGWLAILDTSLGIALGDQNVGFFETEAQVSYHKTFSERSGYALGLRGGIIIPSGSDEDFPIDLRKFMGGANTIRSFPEREMGATFDGDPLGGTAWWIANVEYTRQLFGPVKGVVFVDAGALDSEMELAAGLGVRLDLPVGPVRLEYGHSLSRDSGEPAGAFHFAIGTTF